VCLMSKQVWSSLFSFSDYGLSFILNSVSRKIFITALICTAPMSRHRMNFRVEREESIHVYNDGVSMREWGGGAVEYKGFASFAGVLNSAHPFVDMFNKKLCPA
jgi:hypothetical protein